MRLCEGSFSVELDRETEDISHNLSARVSYTFKIYCGTHLLSAVFSGYEYVITERY